MSIDEWINQVTSEPEHIVTRTVWTTPPDELAKAASPGGVRMTDFLSTAGRRAEHRHIRYRHILGPPASQQAIDAWQSQRPAHPLPGELRDLLTRINGIHLWANAATGRSYVGLAPIDEWELARVKMYGPNADRSLLDDRYIALSYHQDGASFIVLDVESGQYFLMDVSGADASSPIANNVDELLDWLWQNRILPEG